VVVVMVVVVVLEVFSFCECTMCVKEHIMTSSAEGLTVDLRVRMYEHRPAQSHSLTVS
jgi:hypothetical protein